MTTLITIFLVLGLSVLFTAGLRTASGTDLADHITNPQQRPVLGGSDPKTHAWQRFHVRYYTMTLVFVAFEMEMMFMYPWAIVYRALGIKALVEMGVFLVILSLGILYAWREGGLGWQ